MLYALNFRWKFVVCILHREIKTPLSILKHEKGKDKVKVATLNAVALVKRVLQNICILFLQITKTSTNNVVII